MGYLEIAKVVNTHGLSGEVKVLCNYYGRSFSNWKPKQIIYLQNNNDYQPLTIKTVRPHQNFLLVTFENYQKIDSVLFMKNKSLAIINDSDTANDKLSFENLIDYQVLNNQNQKVLGKIVALIDNSHSGLWQINNEQGETFYVPNHQFFIVRVDKKEKKVYLNLISGMFNYE